MIITVLMVFESSCLSGAGSWCFLVHFHWLLRLRYPFSRVLFRSHLRGTGSLATSAAVGRQFLGCCSRDGFSFLTVVCWPTLIKSSPFRNWMGLTMGRDLSTVAMGWIVWLVSLIATVCAAKPCRITLKIYQTVLFKKALAIRIKKKKRTQKLRITFDMYFSQATVKEGLCQARKINSESKSWNLKGQSNRVEKNKYCSLLLMEIKVFQVYKVLGMWNWLIFFFFFFWLNCWHERAI